MATTRPRPRPKQQPDPEPELKIVEVPSDQDGMLKLLQNLDDETLREMFAAQSALEQRLSTQGPQDDEELHAWIKEELGLDIPTVSVCEGHDPPFKFLADLYFERTEAALLMANRGGSKTFLVAVLHWLNSRFKPGCESTTFGATEAQSLRAYAHLKAWIYDEKATLNSGKAVLRPEVASSLMRETIFRNGSRVEVLPGTPQAVNGPHPQKAHADEIELMDELTWKESRNMTVSKRLDDGRLVKPQDIATSTRKGPNGRMQQLIDEIEKAVQTGYQPPRTLYQWCIKETAAQVKGCQIANPDLPEEERCDCHEIKQGEWDDGAPRLLKDICGGDFFRSRGWQPYGDVVKQFRENDRETFEVQQLCSKPEMRHHYVPSWRDEKHLIRQFDADPENGPIFLAVDWGGTNPHAVNWYQLLQYEVEVLTWLQPPDFPKTKWTRRLKEGTLVCFDEIYISEIGNEALGKMVKQREEMWRKRYPTWHVYERFADPQGKSARLDWKAIGLPTNWHTTREFEEHIKDVRSLFAEDTFVADGERCKKFAQEIKQWRADPKTEKQIDTFNHAMSNFRYCASNLKKIRKKLRSGNNLPSAKSIPRATVRVSRPASGPIGFRSKSGKDEFGDWRRRMGGPVTRVDN